MDHSSESSRRLDDSTAVVQLTGKIVIVAMIVLFAVVAVLFLHLHAKWFWYLRDQEPATNGPPFRRRRRHRHFNSASATVLRLGLDPSILNSIPVIVFHFKEFKEGLECSVCLSDISEGEKARLLPKCNHVFQVDCINKWFRSHSTCPLCQNPISSSNSTSAELSLDTVIQSTSDNRPEGMLATDIQRDMNEEEEVKSPVMTRWRRVLSRERKMAACSPSNLDVEEQAGRAQS